MVEAFIVLVAKAGNMDFSRVCVKTIVGILWISRELLLRHNRSAILEEILQTIIFLPRKIYFLAFTPYRLTIGIHLQHAAVNDLRQCRRLFSALQKHPHLGTHLTKVKRLNKIVVCSTTKCLHFGINITKGSNH